MLSRSRRGLQLLLHFRAKMGQGEFSQGWAVVAGGNSVNALLTGLSTSRSGGGRKLSLVNMGFSYDKVPSFYICHPGSTDVGAELRRRDYLR